MGEPGGRGASEKGSAFQILAVDQSDGWNKVPQDLSLTIAPLSALWTNQAITTARHTRPFIGRFRLSPLTFSNSFPFLVIFWTLLDPRNSDIAGLAFARFA